MSPDDVEVARAVEERRKFRRELRHELEAIRGRWGWLLALGIALVVFGVVAMSLPLATTLVTALALGITLILGGVAQLVGAFWTRDWSGFFLVLLMGVLYAVLGVLFLNRPIEAMLALTLMLAAMLLVGGAFKTIASAWHQFPQWGWVFAGGLLELALGLMIWLEWPSPASLGVIGLFVGIDMIFSGWTWIMLALRLRHLGDRHRQATPSPAA
jgi:uncharacterized membrane protein HdeD (DUF308 family)